MAQEVKILHDKDADASIGMPCFPGAAGTDAPSARRGVLPTKTPKSTVPAIV